MSTKTETAHRELDPALAGQGIGWKLGAGFSLGGAAALWLARAPDPDHALELALAMGSAR